MSIISTDMTKAKSIHKNNIRNSRATKFQELDIEYQRAIEADNATKKAEILTTITNEEYKNNRLEEYPDWGTQLDYI